MTNNGFHFEEYVKYVFQSLLNLKGEGIVVSQRATLVSRSGDAHEFDIFYEFKKVGIPHRVAIECKDWRKPVSMGEVQEFESKLRNIPDLRGVMISRSGYQEGAKKFGEGKGILMLKEDALPHFGQVLASWIEAFLLPDGRVTGEPFWAIMEIAEDGINKGAFFSMSDLANSSRYLIPLFVCKRHAEKFMIEAPQNFDGFEPRGISRINLRAFLALVEGESVEFVSYVMVPDNFSRPLPWCRLSREELKADYAFPNNN
jgi:hypothetical protein